MKTKTKTIVYGYSNDDKILPVKWHRDKDSFYTHTAELVNIKRKEQYVESLSQIVGDLVSYLRDKPDAGYYLNRLYERAVNRLKIMDYDK